MFPYRRLRAAKFTGFRSGTVKLDVAGAEHVLFSHVDFVNHVSHATLIGLEIHEKTNDIKEVLKNLNYTIEQYSELILATKINQ
jgi:hypothetical protein